MPGPTWKLTRSPDKLARLYNELCRYNRKRVPQTADAEDLASQALAAGGRLYRGEATPRCYLFSIARTLLADFRKQLNKPGTRSACVTSAIPDVPTDGDDPDLMIFGQYRRDQLNRALPLVPPDYRRTVELKLAGHDNFEIADILGINYNTARSQAARGKRHLMKLLAHVRAENV
jgi:RNA polymerase sigma factor (sigma-70 family)